ncbi:TIGR03618 family F420-dependent PPOX class oxidoreductase [Jatrophihabitans sp.]|uniref:TIGR03618 family F420-dependent PPOX class oxidoreductase n=1 Tax=Jatrophihabitans sp. TaxID=1932789 RepID=UPI0039C8AF33
MSRVPSVAAQLTPAALEFLRVHHLASFTSLRADGTPHVTPVGFTYDPDSRIARIITSGSSRKARNAAAGGPVAVCQVDGRRWLTLEGAAAVHDAPDRVAEAVARYAERYRVPRENPLRVAIEITVVRVLGSSEFITR